MMMNSLSYSVFPLFCVQNVGVSTVEISCQHGIFFITDYYGKIPHNELITIAKVQCT